MTTRGIILVLLGNILLFLGLSFAQIESIGLSGAQIDVGEPVSGMVLDQIIGLHLPGISGEGQMMTELDSGLFTRYILDFSGFENDILAGESILDVISGSSTGESYSGIYEEPISIPIYRLIISEVYYDGTDEWIEITNIGDGDFQGNISLSGVKSTVVSLTDISLPAGISKLFGDTIAQLSGMVQIGKTGLTFSMTDTSAIAIHMSISGQKVDSFLVDQYRVNKYNDKKTSFERVGEISTRVQTDRIANAQDGHIINPGIRFTTGTNIIDVSSPPAPQQQSGTLQLPLSCDYVDQRELIKINEIFRGNEKYPPYIELAIYEDMKIDTIVVSGNVLSTGLVFSRNSGGITLQKNSFLLISATGFRNDEQLRNLQNNDFLLGTTGNRLLITIGSGQNRQVMDIVYVSGYMLGKSSYFNTTSRQCARIMDLLDDFSPGFERMFLKYLPVTTITKIEYIRISTGNQSITDHCPISGTTITGTSITGTTITGTITGTITTGTTSLSIITPSITGEYSIRILNIEYDPPGADANNEKITLLATHISGNQTPLDMSKTFRVRVNTTNKLLSGYLPMDVPTTFTKTFQFPNSTKSGQDVIVSLIYGDHIFDTYTYNPNKLSSEDEEALTSTGYTVSSVIDGDSLRIKYQGKTQNIRLLGIDAPESTKTRYKHLECFGTEAKNHLKSLVDKKKITFQFDPSQDQKDIYDRLLAYIFLDGELINQTMIEDGYAKEYTYKTPYGYQSQFRQAEVSAQEASLGLWNENTCGVSLSGIQLTGEYTDTGMQLNLSGLTFTINYVLPNPKGSDKLEELGLLIDWDEELGSGDEGKGTRENGQVSESLDLSQGFSLHIGTSIKKINGIVIVGQENILSGSLGLVNKAACVSLFYLDQELTQFCYRKPKEGEKIYSSDEGLEDTSKENLDILNLLKLTRIGNQICIIYKEQSFLCKRIPASKAEKKTIQEQKLYKGFASLIKQYIITNRKNLYYDTPLKQYFDLVSKNKTLIGKGITQVDIYGQKVPITNMKQQLYAMETTLPGILALFEGISSLTFRD